MSRARRFLNTAMTYLAGNLLSKLVTFLMIPLYTNELTTESYGDYDVVVTIVTLLVSVAFFQIWDGMFRMSFNFEDEESKYNVISNCMKGYFLCIIIYTVIYIVISRVLHFQGGVLPYAFGLVVGLQYMYSFAARVFLRNKLFAFSGSVNTVVNGLTNIVLIAFLHCGVASLYIAQIVACVIQVAIIESRLRVVRRLFHTSIDFDALKDVLRFSIPLCVATVSYWLLSGYTKFMVNQICGPSENGLFAVANSLANVAVIAVNVFQFAWNETAYLMADEKNRSSLYGKCLKLLFITVWMCCAGFCMIIKLIYPYYVGESFQGSSIVVPYLMIGVSANAIAGFLGTLFMTEQKTSQIMVSTVVSAGINICLSGWATRTYGLIGAVIVLSSSFIALMLIRMGQIKHTLSIPISPLSAMSIVPVLGAIFLYKGDYPLWLNVTYVVMLVVVLFVYLTKGAGIKVQSLFSRTGKG